MAFYKRRVVVHDTAATIAEREAREAARVQVNIELDRRYPDLRTRARTTDEMREVLAWQDWRYNELVRSAHQPTGKL